MKSLAIARTAVLLPLLIVFALLPLGCSGDSSEAPSPAEESASATPPSTGRCLQVTVTVADGFQLDGNSMPDAQLGSSLVQTLESEDRSAVVDVQCEGDVTMASIRRLHDTMREREIYRIQYLKEPAPPIPHLLPSPGMNAHFETLPPEALCAIEIRPSGEVLVDGQLLNRAKLGEEVTAILKTDPELILVLEAGDAVPYVEFFDAMSKLTGAGATRIMIKLTG